MNKVIYVTAALKLNTTKPSSFIKFNSKLGSIYDNAIYNLHTIDDGQVLSVYTNNFNYRYIKFEGKLFCHQALANLTGLRLQQIATLTNI